MCLLLIFLVIPFFCCLTVFGGITWLLIHSAIFRHQWCWCQFHHFFSPSQSRLWCAEALHVHTGIFPNFISYNACFCVCSVRLSENYFKYNIRLYFFCIQSLVPGYTPAHPLFNPLMWKTHCWFFSENLWPKNNRIIAHCFNITFSRGGKQQSMWSMKSILNMVPK